MKPEKQKISAEDLLGRMPSLALSGDDSAVDSILYEVLRLLTSETGADIGQINLLPKGGRVEKVCIIKDGAPWLKKGMGMHLFEPFRGFTGVVLKSGESILARNIWEEKSTENPNPFLELLPDMNDKYIREIKKPIASIIIAPIKRGNDIFCTVELSRYRHRNPFQQKQRELVDDFGDRYGSLIMDYIIDIRNRLAVHSAHQKLLAIARLIASNRKVDYREAVEAYRELSAADVGIAFFKITGFHSSSLRLIPWHGEEIHELFLPGFIPSPDSILRDDIGLTFPLEGEEKDRRILRFHKRIEAFPGLGEEDRAFTLRCLEDIKSYVIYPLHMLSQDLGAVLLGSHRHKFWDFLHMNPFLSLYNSLLKSFLLNERTAHLLSDLSLKIHNPGFYCLAGLKGNLAKKYPMVFADPEITRPIETLENLMNELHDKGKMIKCRKKNIQFISWIMGFVRSKKILHPAMQIELNMKNNLAVDCVISATEENLETIFENLFVNSIRAINTRRQRDSSVLGHIAITVQKRKDRILVLFQDNGIPYKTVSGRGMPRLRSVMQELGGSIRKYYKPFRIYLAFPYGENEQKEDAQ